jgi:hypothetical protein
MIVKEFALSHAVEIRVPKRGSSDQIEKCGSGYRVGGRLVLTVKHIFHGLGSCKVRLASIGEIDAQVVWISPDVDVALVELPETLDACASVQFGTLPTVNTNESVQFLFYGWPNWGFTKEQKRVRSGGREGYGKIRLTTTSPDQLLVLEIENPLCKSSLDKTSIWEGASGAAVICEGCVVAVQSQHPNPEQPAYLEAAPLDKIYENPDWCSFLRKHGISTEPHRIQLGSRTIGSVAANVAVTLGRPSVEQRMAQALQDLGYGGQQKVFDNFLESDRVIEAFVVEVNFDDESDLQKCLVSRLSRDLIGGTSPMFRTLGVRREWQDNPLRKLTSGLAPDLGLAETADVKEVHECLLRLARTQSVVIALYEVPKMGSDSLAKLMDEFWYPLVKQVEDSQGQVVKKRILLFLAGVGPMVSLLEQANGCDTLDYPEAMDNIRGSDLEEWRRITRVKQLINCRQEIVPDIKDELKRFRPMSNAYQSIENVCEIFGFKGDLGQFEAFWQLSGDLVA